MFFYLRRSHYYFFTFNDIKSVSFPTSLLARHISPILGTIMSIAIILVIYGLMYAFVSRVTTLFSKQYYVFIIVMAIITFICTFLVFISLIGKMFPIMGLFGFILLIPILYKGIKHFRYAKKKVQEENINFLLNLLIMLKMIVLLVYLLVLFRDY